MEASIGKALRDARLKRNLTLEEAAQVTKINADRLNELEQDEYSRFPSLAYARNFLILYAKFLDVDIAKYPTLDIGKPVFSSDYQYMQGDLGTIRWTGPRRKPVRRKRWFLAMGVLVTAVCVGAVTAMVILDILRLPNFDAKEESNELAAPSPFPSPTENPSSLAVASPTPDVAAESNDEALLATSPATAGVLDPSTAEQGPTEGENTDGTNPEATPAETFEEDEASAAETPTPASTPTLPPEPTPEPTPTPTPTPEPSPTPAVEEPVKEIKVRASKRTRVKVTRDVAGSTPVYNGWLAAGKTVSFRGKHFWVESSVPGAIKVTSNGKPVQTEGRSGTTNRR